MGTNDDLGLEGKGGEGSPPEETFTQDDFMKALDSGLTATLSPLVKEMGGAIGQVSKRLEALEGKGREGDGEGDLDATVKELLSDPEGAIAKRVDAALKARGDGPVAEIVEAQRESHLKALAGEVDETFGEGTWEEYFEEDMRRIVDRLPPKFQIQRETLEAGVATIKGDKFKELSELIAKRAETRKKEDAELSRMGYTRLPPGRMPPPRDQELSQEEMGLLKKLNDAGAKIPADLVHKMKDIGPTIDDWRAVVKPKAKEA